LLDKITEETVNKVKATTIDLAIAAAAVLSVVVFALLAAVLIVKVMDSLAVAGMRDNTTTVPALAPVAPAPSCEEPLAVLEGAEVLVLRRNGSTADLVVMYAGGVRGRLVTIDIVNRVMIIPSRPPYGWSIGGR
jgi:hypothetical protein